MKKFIPAVLIAFLFSSIVIAQENKEKPRIEGSGNVITRDVAVQSFENLSISGIFSVLLSQGNQETVKIEAEDNLQDLFEVKNEGSTLKLSMKKDVNFNSNKKMKVYVTFKKLKSMDLKTIGNVSSEENLSFDDLEIENKSIGSVDLKLTTQSINVNNKSVGNVRLNGKAENAVIKNDGVGSIQAANFLVQKMDIENTGVGSAEVNAAKELKVKDSFLGKVVNKGNATAKRSNKVVI